MDAVEIAGEVLEAFPGGGEEEAFGCEEGDLLLNVGHGLCPAGGWLAADCEGNVVTHLQDFGDYFGDF